MFNSQFVRSLAVNKIRFGIKISDPDMYGYLGDCSCHLHGSPEIGRERCQHAEVSSQRRDYHQLFKVLMKCNVVIYIYIT